MNQVAAQSGLLHAHASPPMADRKICLVTGELEGPFFNGGIGTTNRALALFLRSLGCQVDILYTHVGQGKPICLRGKFSDHVAAFQALGIDLKCIDHSGNWYDWQARSYLALQHLLQHQYQAVFFDDLEGAGYYPLLARKTGNPALRNTVMCVTCHSATQWITEQNGQAANTFDTLRLIEMERLGIELADAIKAPSAYILRKYSSYGWTIPQQSIVLPNFVSDHEALQHPREQKAITEIVFFGRLEARKGLWMFCAALDRLKYQLDGRQVTFLGKADDLTAEALVRRSVAWPFAVRLLTNFNREQALAYLKTPGRVAVLPAVEDNSPSAIIECLQEGIPFIACTGSGGEELLDEKSRKHNLFQPSAVQLCEKLLEMFQRGATVGAPSFDQAKLRTTFAEWLDHLLDSNAFPPRPAEKIRPQNPVLVVVVPAECHPRFAAAELERTVHSFDRKVHIEALAAKPNELRKELATHESLSIVNVAGFGDFEHVAQSLSSRRTVVGLCHITQLLSRPWLERAQSCFASNNGISALTGMVGIKKKRRRRVREAYVSVANHNFEIQRYLIGCTPPLFSLIQETNEGFVLLRSELLTKCSSVRLADEQYHRPKRMRDWIHEILVTMHLSGERFALIPDLVSEQVVTERDFEVFRIEHFMRSLPGKLCGYMAGTEQAAVSRLTIDIGLARERALNHSKYISHISERIGREVSRLPLYAPWEDQSRQLAMLAHANGQIELAVDICAELAIQEGTSKPVKLNKYLVAVAAGEIVELAEAVTANREIPPPKQSNRKKPIAPERGEDARKIDIVIKPGSIGLVGFVLPSLNLRKITHFRSVIQVLEQTSGPVCFRVELRSQGKRPRWVAERIINGGEEKVWEFECPDDLREECTVRFGVELADHRQSSKSVKARWVNPRFIRHLKERTP